MERKVSIVVPCRNEKHYIAACIRSIRAADPAGCRVTVLVCDGMSDDGTRAIVEGIAKEDPSVRLIDNPQRTTPQALNIGLRHMPFDVGIILGAHAEIDPGFIRENLKVLDADPSVGCAGGLIENVFDGPVSRRIGAAMGHPFGVGGAHFRTGARDGYVDTVAFGAYRRQVFNRVGWFDEELVRNQDDEFNYRVVQGGFKIFLSRAIRSKYYVRASYGRLFRQYVQYGYWKVYVNCKHRTITTLRQVVPALFVLYLCLAPVLAAMMPVLRWPLLAVLLVYMAAAMVSAFKARTQHGDMLGVMRAFVSMHVAYGWGYLKGIFRFMLLGAMPSRASGSLTR
ncbi:MAG: glycosyltransferase family 2 protein [Bacteroidetes bacterium]|nr:glycosyltransferase family 2 protein [Bacteroidota bacterium]MBS1941239.1 glycosyltransferase family 2 protein [Bacteroidota bacterium]